MIDILSQHEDKWQPEPNTGCFLWHGSLNRDGYARVGVKGINKSVARLVTEETHGPAPDGHTASHLCDVRACVNPKHLIWESRGDNVSRIPRSRLVGKLAGKGKGYKRHGRGFASEARIGGKTLYLGTFDTEDEAKAAYAKFWKENKPL